MVEGLKEQSEAVVFLSPPQVSPVPLATLGHFGVTLPREAAGLRVAREQLRIGK